MLDGVFTYVFLFPVGLLIATVAMSSGVSGSNFWLAIFFLWLRLEPRTAFWVSLVTMLCGFGSGVIRNLLAGTYDRTLVAAYGPVLVVAAALGAQLSKSLRPEPLLTSFAVFVIFYGLWLMVRTPRPELMPPGRGVRWPLAALAGGLQGAITTGAGSVLLPAMLGQRANRPAHAVGSSVILVFAASLAAAFVRLDAALIATLKTSLGTVVPMIIWAGGGAVVGGQLGPRVAARLSSTQLPRYVGGVLIIIGLLVASRAA